MATAYGTSDEELLAMAASVKADSEHPIAKAIVAAGKNRACRSSLQLDLKRSPDGERKQSSAGKPYMLVVRAY
jgi:Cu2+-exporting ATPase